MAEFKLGRIRFVWKGDWTASNVYYQDDVVSFGGKTYICVIGHTSDTDFFTDLDIVPSKWNLVSDGQTWKGAWQTSTSYVYDDIVSYGARLYICNTSHTSASTAIDETDGLEADLSKWDAYAEGLDWKGNWTTSTRYRINDIVRYGGAVYVCNTLHVSTATEADGLETDIAYWDVLNQGLEYKGDYASGVRYKLNDIVRYGAGSWICVTPYTSAGDFGAEGSNWVKFVEGFQYENDWSPFRGYQPGDVVRYGGNQYISKTTNLESLPTQNTNDWDLFSEGVRFVGDWNEDSSNQHYKVGEVVRLGGFTYICTQDHTTSQQPPNADYWLRINEGFRWRGEWLDDQEYFEGDVVRYLDSSYICIKYHISEGDDYSTETLVQPGGGAAGSRPDLADSGQYWAVIAIGTEQSVLTTTGDLVYYSGSAPTRLPIGKEGQVLRVGAEGIPQWEFLQSVEDIYYVAEHGVDNPYPEYGSNIDRPFKSIRYAAEQIEKGTKKPNAQYMLELNRVFIQKEVSGYIRDQVANATPGSIWENFTFDTLKCERDVGFVIDRIKWDMGHGGNLKVRAAAQTFLNALDDGPYSTAEENNGTGPYANLATEGAQSVAAYNYMLTVIGNVLANEAPSTIYQNVTDDSVAIVDQYFNANLEIESDALTRITELANIIITVLGSGDTNDIPERSVPQTLIKVSTGKHYEYLPIIVPAYCAILGDELRSTHIIAAGKTTPANDTKFTVKTFDRVKEVVRDVIQGSQITSTEGNTVAQSRDWPLAPADTNDFNRYDLQAQRLVDVMKYQIDYGLNTMESGYVANHIGLTDGKKNAVDNIKANIDFLLEEVIAYLDDEYPSLKYGKTDTRRDARYIIDSLIYDLTYGGNSQAVRTGLAYFDGDDDTIPQLPASIKTETIAAINYLKTTAQSVAGNTSVINPKQSVITQTLTGVVGDIAEIANNIEDIIDIIDNGPTAVGSSTTLVDPTLANDVNSTTDLIADFNTVDGQISTIQTNTISYINTNYPTLVYDSAKCSRDVGIILKAINYDMALNSNWQTLKVAHSYLRKTASEVYTLNQKTVTREAIRYAIDEARAAITGGTVNDPRSVLRLATSRDTIDAIIFGATNEGSVCQTEDQNAYYAMLQLERNRDYIVEEVKNYVNYNFVNFDNFYNSTTCERDMGYWIDAAKYDLITGSNFASFTAGNAYARAVTSAETVTGKQLMQTLSTLEFIRDLSRDFVDSTNYASVWNSFTLIYDIIKEWGENASLLNITSRASWPGLTFPDNGTTVADDSTTAATFQANKETYVTGVTNWISANYPALVYDSDKCERDVRYIVDAVTFDIKYGGNYQSVIAGDSYYSYSVLQLGAGEKPATLGAYGELKSLMAADAEAASVAGTQALLDDIISIIDNGAGTVTTTYPSETGETATTQTSFTDLSDSTPTIITAATGHITAEFSSYTYNESLCLRDVGLYIDALKYDIMYPGNYQSRYVARYYNNSVTGSQEEDMFYLRDATGVRNCTLNGLNGQLTPENTYGTSRCTAGAYCSLDPGFGPEDFKTWIITRSPYIQGVTTFGNAATGQKIDGALHNGGNDSMVSNDFTQVISDGIGAHILNNGRAELVSVFTYYSHIGYLAETGGRVRATNGNNSYGDWGSVAEGVDPDETPVSAIVDNRTQYNATIGNVNIDNSGLYNLEYSHAGNDYSDASINIFGPGTGEIVIADEFRDDAVNYLFVDQDPDPNVPQGGSGYVIVSNVAQSGSLTGIFLAATDGNLSTAYPGMKIYIIGGAGIGQYAIVNTYNAGTKEMTVIKESDGTAGWDHVVPGTTIVAPNSSSTYQIEPRIQLASPPKTSGDLTLPASTTWNDVKFIKTAAQYTGVSVTGGDGSALTFDVTRNGFKYFLTINAAGTGYTRLNTVTIAGTDVGGASPANDITVTLTTVNSATGAVVDFDFAGTGKNGRFLAVGGGTNGALSDDGITWTSETLPTLAGGFWSSIASGLQDDGSSTFKPSAIVVVADGDSDVAYSEDADTWNNSTLPVGFNTGAETRVAYGNVVGSDPVTNRFIVISSADTDIARSENGGQTWTLESAALPTVGYDGIAYGAGKFVAIRSGTQAISYSDDGVTWSTSTAPGTLDSATDIVWGNGKFVVLGGTNGIMYSFDGITWLENQQTLPLTVSERKLAYGQGVFVVTSDDTDQIMTSEDGVYWTSYTLTGTPVTSGFNACAFGNPGREGIFVLLPNAAGTAGQYARIGATAKARAAVSNEQIFEVRFSEPGSGYDAVPTITVTDPNNIDDVVLTGQLGKGSLANPTFANRGTGFTSASAEIDAQQSDGYADFPQTGAFIAVRRLSQRPVNGSNVVFDSLPGQFFKLVNTVSFIGSNDGSYTGFLQISPDVEVSEVLPDGDPVELRIRFSQVRLTGHDFLDIGTGGFAETNYPGVPVNTPDQTKETQDSDGGRVFYTATDQDGNFRVGDLFTIEQSTGVATLNAEAFNIAGLQELSLGEVTLGGNSASVNEFSTDPFFTANSDSVVPTQRAVKAYIESQIGGGGATLNVNSVTAGDIFIGSNTITTLSGAPLNIKANVVFSGTVLGLPLAYNYFLR